MKEKTRDYSFYDVDRSGADHRDCRFVHLRGRAMDLRQGAQGAVFLGHSTKGQART